MLNTAKDFKKNVTAALSDKQLQKSLNKLEYGLQARRRNAIDKLPEFEDIRDQAKYIKKKAINNIADYLEQFEAKVIASGGHVHWARNATEAQKIIHDICLAVDAKTVAKGKSMATEEIMLNEYLEEQGIKVVETDLAEYILQLRQEPPTHIVVPAFHLSKNDIAQTFYDKHNDLDSARSLESPNDILKEARKKLRSTFINADVGITGANFLIAETGSIVIVTNEGNGDLVQTLPRTHIVVAGIEKIVASLEESATLLRVLSRSATGQDATSYVTFSTGPRQDNNFDGPDKFHVVLLDNGRNKFIGTDNESILHCIRCGACMNHCPVYGAVGGRSYGWVYPGPLGAALNPGLLGIKTTQHLPNASTFCGRCDQVCPVKIPLTKIMRNWRNMENSEKVTPIIETFLITIWQYFVLRPRLYRFFATLTVKMIATLNFGKGTFRWFPMAGAWTRYRDLPSPQGYTFQTLWHKQQKNKDQKK